MGENDGKKVGLPVGECEGESVGKFVGDQVGLFVGSTLTKIQCICSLSNMIRKRYVNITLCRTCCWTETRC